MPSDIDPTRLVGETIPVAVVLAFWNAFAVIVPIGSVAFGLMVAGVAMALLYVAGRASRLAETVHPGPVSIVPTDHLRENAHLLLVASVWFLPAVVGGLFTKWLWPGNGDEIGRAAASLVAVPLAGAGAAVVLLYALAVAIARRDARADVDRSAEFA